MDLVIYLGFDGQCEEAFKTYAKVLRGEILMMVRNSDGPPGACAPGMENRIMHARLKVGDAVLMGGDAPPDRASKPQGFCANIMLDDVAEAERVFRELGEGGGTVQMPMAETFWARRFGMLVDRFGTPWMVNCEKDATAQETPLPPFSISRTLEASREVVWQAFTDPERMKRWWGPKGAKIIASHMDLRPGGTYHYGMQMPDGQELWGRFVFRQIVPKDKLVFVSSFSDPRRGITRHPMAPQWPIEMLSTFAFTDAGDGRTTFTVTWAPLYPTSEEQAAFEGGRASMQQGWSGTLEQLESYLRQA